jgi:hypothetical protein
VSSSKAMYGLNVHSTAVQVTASLEAEFLENEWWQLQGPAATWQALTHGRRERQSINLMLTQIALPHSKRCYLPCPPHLSPNRTCLLDARVPRTERQLPVISPFPSSRSWQYHVGVHCAAAPQHGRQQHEQSDYTYKAVRAFGELDFRMSSWLK